MTQNWVKTTQHFLYLFFFFERYTDFGLFQPKFGSNMNKPKCWVKNVIKKGYNFKLHF